ncbi:MAG: NAD(P)-dependent oxidoreductase [Erysipelotrichaceae bacterium]|nr:NAD(P)-dependent oxidoreductase [Erysipelotrichaceae bacterium]
MKIAITGATGVIGTQTVALLSEKPDLELVCLTRGGTEMNEIFDSQALVRFVQTDYSVESLQNILTDVDMVVHLAAIRGGNSSKGYEAFSENVTLMESILKAMVKANVKKIIYLSSISVYSDLDQMPWREDQQAVPVNFYGLSKLNCEMLCTLYKKFGISSLIFRTAHVLAFENRGYMLGIFLKNAAAGKPLSVNGKSEAHREFIYVKDVARAIVWGIENPEVEGIFNLGSGEALTNYQVAERINEAFQNNLITYKDDVSEGIVSSVMDSSKLNSLGFRTAFSFYEGAVDIKKDVFDL